MTRLVTFGCSHTFGQALPDIWDYKKNIPIVEQGPSKYAWPQLLADKLNLECVNLSIPGASSKQIWFRIVNTKFQPNDIVIVMWSSRPRHCIIKKLDLTIRNWYETNSEGIEKLSPFLMEKNKHKPSKYFLKYIYNECDHFIDFCMRINYVSLLLKNKIKLLKNCVDEPLEFTLPKWFDSDLEKINFRDDVYDIYPKALDNQHTGKEGNKAFADILYDNINSRG